MRAENIVILHLSDLHFSGASLRRVHEDLLDDIKEMMIGAKQIVILVTGDVMDKGRFSHKKQTAINFFHRLRANIPAEAKILYFGITPGNHDYKRADWKTKFNSHSYKPDTSKFERLLKDIYDEFALPVPDRYGVDVVKYNGLNLCFARIDSSWHASLADLCARARKGAEKLNVRENDILNNLKRNLIQDAQNQRRYLIDRWKVLFGESNEASPYLTFVLSHFPLTLLIDTGIEEVQDILEGGIGLKSVDYWICGHLHYAKIRQVQDEGLHITTLMSGIGNEKKDHDSQRYSIYTLSFERNTCNVCVRVSKNGGGFDYDWNSSRACGGRTGIWPTLHLKPDEIMPFVSLSVAKTIMAPVACSMDSEMISLFQGAHRISVKLMESLLRHADYLMRRIVEESENHRNRPHDGECDLWWDWYSVRNSGFPAEVYELVRAEMLAEGFLEIFLRAYAQMFVPNLIKSWVMRAIKSLYGGRTLGDTRARLDRMVPFLKMGTKFTWRTAIGRKET